MVGQWFALSGFDSQLSLCGVDISSQCLRGVFWGGWLSKFNYKQGRSIVETKRNEIFVIVLLLHEFEILCLIL